MSKPSVIYFYLWFFYSGSHVNCYQWGSCVGSPFELNSPIGYRSHVRSIRSLQSKLVCQYRSRSERSRSKLGIPTTNLMSLIKPGRLGFELPTFRSGVTSTLQPIRQERESISYQPILSERKWLIWLTGLMRRTDPEEK